MGKPSKEEEYFYDWWQQLYEIQISVSLKFYLNTAMLIYVLSVIAFILQWQSLVVVTEIIYLQTLKYLLSDHLEKKFASPYSRVIKFDSSGIQSDDLVA